MDHLEKKDFEVVMEIKEIKVSQGLERRETKDRRETKVHRVSQG